LGAFGEKLRKQREQRGIALDAISNTTKISPRMLRALEDEHFDQLPGGVFNKGFVRAYARQVGLDEEEAVTDYLAALRESQIQQQSILPDFRTPAGKPSAAGSPDLHSIEPSRENPHHIDLQTDDLAGNEGSDHDNQPSREDRRKKKEDRRNRQEGRSSLPDSTTPPTANSAARRSSNRYPAGSPGEPLGAPSARFPWGMLAAALVLMTLLLALWNRRSRDTTATSNLVVTSNPSKDQTPPPAPAPTQPSGSASVTAGKPSPAGTLSTGELSPGTISTETASPRPAPTVPVASPSSKVAGSSPASTVGSAASKPAATMPAETATPPPAKTKTPGAAAKPPSTFTLLIRAEKTTWISIVADGKTVAEETLIAPAHTSVRASREIVVRAGNAAGVSFLLNGKEFPAQGNDGEVKTYVFSATSLRALPQSQLPSPNP
jgi:cytoskeletal protein RodZ